MSIVLNQGFIEDSVTYMMGLIKEKQGKFQEAGAYYERTIKLNPNHHEAYNQMGVIAYKVGAKDFAADFWQRCLKIKPDYLPAIKNLEMLTSNK